MTTVTTVEVTLAVAAPPAEVFRYWTDPVRYVRWMGAWPRSMPGRAAGTRWR